MSRKKKYIGSLWSIPELSKQQAQSQPICHFCTNKNACIFESGLKKDQWCGTFEANPAHFYTFKGWTYYSPKNREVALEVYRKLLSNYPFVLAICVEHEKPLGSYRQECKNCGKRAMLFYGRPEYSGTTCASCLLYAQFDPKLAVLEEFRNPICEILLKVKKRLAYGVNKLTHEISDKAKRERRKKGEQE